MLAQDVLASGCFKPAATREAIGLELYGRLFQQGRPRTLKAEDGSDQPIKELSTLPGSVANRLAGRRKAAAAKRSTPTG